MWTRWGGIWLLDEQLSSRLPIFHATFPSLTAIVLLTSIHLSCCHNSITCLYLSTFLAFFLMSICLSSRCPCPSFHLSIILSFHLSLFFLPFCHSFSCCQSTTLFLLFLFCIFLLIFRPFYPIYLTFYCCIIFVLSVCLSSFCHFLFLLRYHSIFFFFFFPSLHFIRHLYFCTSVSFLYPVIYPLTSLNHANT